MMFNEKGQEVKDPKDATQLVIQEVDDNGRLLNETVYFKKKP